MRIQLIVLLLVIAYALQEELLPLKVDQDYVQARRSMDNLIVEEGEIQHIDLAYYFRGQLMKFELTSQQQLDPFIQADLDKLVRWRSRYIPLQSQYITDESFKILDTDPFPQSSIIIEESNINRFQNSSINHRTGLYFVTKDLKFTHYDVSQYSKVNGEIVKVQEQQLNLTHKNSLCRDLTYIKLRKMPPIEGFLFFCKGYRRIDETIVGVHTLIYIGKTRFGQYSTREYAWLESDLDFRPDFKKGSSGLRYIKELGFDNQFLYFYGLGVNKTDGQNMKMIVSLNIQPLLVAVNQSYQEGPPLIKHVQEFEIKQFYDFNLRVLDFLLIKNVQNLFFFAFSVEAEGLRVCHFPSYMIGNSSHPVIECNKEDARVMVGIASPALYKNFQETTFWRDPMDENPNREGEYFYGIRFKPPEIVEYDMSDLLNIRMFKKYSLVDYRKDNLVGTRFIAVNRNYVLHMMSDPETSQQTVRVYSRYATNIDSAKLYITMDWDSLGNFMGFPNRYFDVVIMRDERQVNVSTLGPAEMVMDATNSTLVNRYKGQPFYMRVVANDGSMSSRQEFSVTFLEKHNNGIYAIQDGILPRNLSVFYNCGEDKFNYIVSKHFDGPNYNLFAYIVQNKYFYIENQLLWMTYEHPFNFTNCKRNFIFPRKFTGNQTSWYKNEHMVPVLMLCADFQNMMLRSYELKSYRDEFEGHQYVLEKEGTIKIPFTEFLDFTYDIKEQMLLGLVKNVDMIDTEHAEDYSALPSKYVFHIFKVEDDVVWKKEQHYKELNNITFFGYNHLLDLGIVIDYDTSQGNRWNIALERFYIFEFHESKNEISPIFSQGFYVNAESEMTIKAVIASEQALFTMKSGGRIQLHQLSNTLELIQEYFFPDLINFDIFDNLYFVVYSGKNAIQVYIISNYVQISYKMTLPLYREYSDYSFLQNHYFDFHLRQTGVVRAFKDGILAVLFTAPSSNPQISANNTQLITFGLAFTQHNTFIMSQDVSNYYPNVNNDAGQFANLIFTDSGEQAGSGVHTSICVMSWQYVAVFNAQYYNQLSLNTFEQNRDNLQQRCKSLNNTDQDGFMKMQLLDTLSVLPQSQFTDKTNISKYQELKINVLSENQGLAVTQKSKDDIHITYSEDSGDTLSILLESYVEGQALRLETSCFYGGLNGTLIDCTKQAVTKNDQDTPYNFSIEFVTNERKIVKMFTMGNLFFMLDTQYRLNVMRFPNYKDNLGTVNGYPLFRVNESDQVETFGCQLNGWADIYNLTDAFKPKNDSFLFLYQCNNQDTIDGGSWLLRAAIITSFKQPYREEGDSTEESELYEIVTFEGTLQLPYRILDVDKVNQEKENPNMQFLIAVSCENDNIESNVLYFYKLILYVDKGNVALFSFVKSFSTYSLRFDTFKVNKLLAIIQSGLLFAVCENYGVHVFNMTLIGTLTDNDDPRDYLVGSIDVVNDIVFREQQMRETEEAFQIVSLTFNLPTEIVLITNYGIFTYEFGFDLTNLTEILLAGSFTQTRYRQIAMSYDIAGSTIVRNSYGNAFLAMERVSDAGDGVFRTKLISMSYYSAQNSQIFKSIDVVQVGARDQCIAINQNPYFEYTPEDQIAVTFICNQYLYMFRVCMRPQVIVDLAKVAPMNNKNGQLGYNDFDIAILATNEVDDHINDYINSELIFINLRYSQIDPLRSNLLVCLAITAAIGLTVVLIFYIDNAFTKGTEEKQASKREVRFNASQITSGGRSQFSRSVMRYRESEVFNMSPSSAGLGNLRNMLNLNKPQYPTFETQENESGVGAINVTTTVYEEETEVQRCNSRETQSFTTGEDNRIVAHQNSMVNYEQGIQHDDTMHTESTLK